MVNGFSHTGILHKTTNGENQDHICSGTDRTKQIITLADGVSECAAAKTGAEIAADTVTRLFLRKGTLLQEYSEEEIAEMTIRQIMYELELAADTQERDIIDYSSTLASVMHDRKTKKLLCMNLGDGMILAVSGDLCYVLAEPFDSSEGCCVTTTAGAAQQTTVKLLEDTEADTVIICSDGAWRHMFERGRMKEEIRSMFIARDFEGVENYLTGRECGDDNSLIYMDIDRRTRRRQ